MKVLVVDDADYSRRALQSVFLSAGYAVLAAEDGQRALEIAREERPDLVVTDILMPRLDGFQLCRALKADRWLRKTPVIFYTGDYGQQADRELGLSLGAAAYLVKPLEPAELMTEVGKAIGHPQPELQPRVEREVAEAYADRVSAKLQEKVAKLNGTVEKLDALITSVVAAFGLALAAREGEDPIESERPARLAQLFTERVAPELAADPNVLRGYLIHDLGKLTVPDSVLRKPGPLTDQEREVFRRQRRLAADILHNVPGMGRAIDIVRHCREWYDGSGFPDHQKGEQIPLAARIFAVADAFDAMIRGRHWRPKRSVAEALAELRRCAGTQFDPALVEPFTRMIGELQTK